MYKDGKITKEELKTKKLRTAIALVEKEMLVFQELLSLEKL
jgi:hypothetical protein